jgi:two-component system, OmpR family, phosphate regulon sensor histidine kinase PhoR
MYYAFSWFKILSRLVGFFLPLILIGLYFEKVTLAIALGALFLVGLHYWNLYQLNHWLWHSKKITPPEKNGAWEQIYEGIYALNRRNRIKRKELGTIVRRFHEGSEALPDAAVVVDEHANITWCNRLARIELGLQWPADQGRRIDNFIRHPKFITYFHSGNFEKPVEVPSPTNSQKIFEYRIMPYGDKHLMLVVRDITRISQLEQMRKDFVANVSHELRTPLTVISGYLEMLPDSADHPAIFMEKALREMSSQTSRMRSLIEELLVLSRIEASNEPAYEKVVNVPKLLAQLQAEAKSLNREKDHKIFFDVSPDLTIYGVETELRSAFSNLIVNAINYTPNKGVIEVKWNLVNKKARFTVKDNGDGIAEEHLGRLTERFYRVDKARSRKTGGSGLGLSIVKHVLTHHNSKLKISSVVGRGSEFSFDFPAEITLSEENSLPAISRT